MVKKDQQYVARKAIFIGRARVANPGDRIPASHPKFKEWEDRGLVGPVDATSSDDSGNSGEDRPDRSASKADWVAYATDETRGADQLTEQEANDLTKAQLADLFA